MSKNLQPIKEIYFIYSYPKSFINRCSIWIESEQKINNEMTLIESKIIPGSIKEDFFKFIAKIPLTIQKIQKLKFSLKLKVDEDFFNSNDFEFDLTKTYFFIYNLEFKKKKKYSNTPKIYLYDYLIKDYISPPKIYNMDFKEQYDFYKKNLNLNDNPIQLKDFNYYSLNQLENLSEINFIYFLHLLNDYEYKKDFENIQTLIILFSKATKIKLPIAIQQLEIYKQLIKTLSNEYQKNSGRNINNENQNYCLGLHKIILYFYYIQKDDKNFNNYLKNNNNNNEIKEMILKQNSIFEILNFDCIKSILKNAKDQQDIYLSLKKCENIEILLTLICDTLSNILKVLRDSNDDIEIDFIGNKSDNIHSIINLYNKCIQNQMEETKKIKLNDSLWYKYISIFKNDDIDKLFQLYTICTLLSEDEINNFRKNLFEAIDETIKSHIINQNLKNSSMLEFLKKCVNALDSYLNENEKNNKKLNVAIYNYIDLSLIDENLIQIFKEIDLDKFKSNQIDGFLKKVNSLKEFYYIIKLFENRKNILIKLIDQLTKIFSGMMKKEKDKNTNEFSDFISQIIILIPFTSERLFQEIENFLNEDKIAEIYLNILNNTNHENNIKVHIFNFLIKKHNFTTNVLQQFLSVVKKENIIKELLNSLNDKKYVVLKQDFYDIKEIENLKIVDILIKKEIFLNIKYKDTEYIKKVDNTILSVNNELVNFKIKFENIKKLHELYKKNVLNKRLNIILYKEFPIYKEDFENKLIEKIKEIMDFKEKIEKIQLYFETFYNENKDKELQVYHQIEKEMENKELKELGNYIEEKYKSQNIDNIYNNAVEILNYCNSKIFNLINSKENYDSTKSDKENLENSIKNFKSLCETLLNDLSSINCLNFENYLQPFEKKDEIEKELTFIKNTFNKNSEINKQINGLFIIKNKKTIISYLDGVIKLFEQFKIPKGDFYRQTIRIKYNLKKEKILPNISSIIKQIYVYDTNLCDNLEITYINYIINLFQNEKFVPFIIDKKEQDIKEIEESIWDIDNQGIQFSDIKHLLQIIIFKELLKKDINSRNDEEFLNYFKQLLIGKEKDNLMSLEILKDLSSIEKFNLLVELFSKTINKSEHYKTLILHLLLSSKYEIKSKNECNVYYGENYKKKKLFSEILEIKELIILRKKNESCENEIEKFLNIIDIIENLLELIDNISSKGYLPDINCDIEISKDQELCKINNEIKYYSLSDLFKHFTDIFEELKKDEEDGYTKFELIRLLYGKQFIQIYKNISSNQKDYNLIFINKFITNNILSTTFNYDFSKIIKDKNIYESINEYIKKIYEKFLITFSNLLQNSTIKNVQNNKYYGIYTYLSSKENYEKDIIKISKYLTGNEPCAQTFFLCTSSTRREEVMSFIYRVIKCKTNTLFIILKSENLTLDISSYLIQLLERLLKNFKNKNEVIKSCLLFIYLDQTSDLINKIKQMEIHKYFNFPIDYTEEIIIKNNNKIEVIYSDASGVGKSYYIIEKYLSKYKKDYEYLYFPIEGDCTKEEILKRLLEIKGKVFIHLDILDINKKELRSLIRDFLFCFLILKYYSHDYDIFYYGNNFIINIETSFGIDDPFILYPILSFFPKKNITKENLKRFIWSEEFNNNIQLVSQYLNLYKNKEINDISIFVYFKDISEIVLDDVKQFTKIGNIENQPEEIGKNMKNLIPLKEEECSNLIIEYFNKDEKEKQNPTFYQLNAFINVLFEQLKFLCGNYYLNAGQLKKASKDFSCPELGKIRSYIIESLIKLSKYCTKSAYNSLLNGQNESQKYYNEEESLKQANEYLTSKKVISFDELLDNTDIIFFNEDVNSITIITKKNKNSKEYQNLLQLYNSGNLKKDKKTKKRIIENLIDYSSLKNEQFLFEINKVLALNLIVEDLKSIVKNYVFTQDNFIKLILILLKIRAKIPIIMMGETGCGKTSLIKMISQLKKNIMLIFKIHAGITNKNIITFIEENNLYKLNNEQNNYSGNIWIFLDEINTCNSMGLISEMMCKGTIQGKQLKDNCIFIAACNPYRKYEKKIEEIGLVSNNQKKRNLVYSVNPLPYCLLNFVFDFGSLKEEDEKKYIESIISKGLKELSNGFLLLKSYENIYDYSVKKVFISHKFIREKSFSAAVSLREIRRYIILFSWFLSFINNTINEFEEILKQYDISIEKSSVLLSIYICYFIRIRNKKEREEFNQVISQEIDFQKFIKSFQMQIIKYFNIEKGIGKTVILLENLFTLFVCINLKIPIIICGKPGYSKSLSIKIIQNSMKGENSDNDFFRKFPALKKTPYQGSITSTSEGILKAFEIAKKKIEENTVSLLYFDEMGLAEISPNNPLKVIHYELEYDDNEQKIAFVGISNWSLDASKMNRTIFLFVNELDQEDLENIASSIAEDYEKGLENKYKFLLGKLAICYFKFKEETKDLNFEYEFHGARDYYHLIKNLVINLKKNNNEIKEKEPLEIAIKSIERNFGGRKGSISTFKKIISSEIKYIETSDCYNIRNAIIDNLKDYQSRFLMVISDLSISQFLIRVFLEQLNLESKSIFYTGSHFEVDLKDEYYSASMLNKIQIPIEKGEILIMNNLESIYPSLYDLFNQNYTYIGQQKMARIALGYSHDIKINVHPQCRIIILIDHEQISKQDPPFLNRFEKHILSYERIFSKEKNEFSKRIFKILKQLIKPNSNKDVKINLSKHLLNYNKEEINGIIYKSNSNDLEKIKFEIFKKFVPTFSQELIVFSSNSLFASNFKEDYKIILDIYNSTEHRNLKFFLQNIKNFKYVIYTFSHILDFPEIEIEIENETFGKINQKSIYKQIISEICGEKIIEQYIKNYYINDEYKLCFFQIYEDNSIHLNHIHHLYERFIKIQQIKKEKPFILIIHLKREIILDENKYTYISHLSSFEQLFIDNLNGKDLAITKLINVTNYDIYKDKTYFDIDNEFDQLIFPVFTTISYDIENPDKHINIENYYEKLTEKLNENEGLKTIIKEKLLEWIKKDSQFYLYSIFYDNNNNFDKNDIDFFSIFKNFLRYNLKIYFIKFVIKAERDIVFPIFFTPKLGFQEINILLEKYIQEMDISKINIHNKPKGNRIITIQGLLFPMIKKTFDRFLQEIEKIKKKYFILEDNLRYDEIETEEKKYKEKKEIDEKEIYENVKNECEQFELFKFLNERKNQKKLSENIFNYIQNDFYLILLVNKFKNKNLLNLRIFLNYLIKLKFPKNESNNLLFLTQSMIWIKNYEDIIFDILILFDKLDERVPNLLNSVSKKMEKNIFNYCNEKMNCDYQEDINGPFYYILSFLIEIISEIEIDKILIYSDEKIKDKYFDILKFALQIILQIRFTLNFSISKVYFLSQIVKFGENLKKIDKFNETNLKEYVFILNKETLINEESTENEINQLLEQDYECIKKNFPTDYHQLVVNLFTDKYRQISNEKFRKKLFIIVCSDDSLLIKAKNLFGRLIKYIQEFDPIYDNDNDNDNENDDSDESKEENEYKTKFLSFIDDKNEILKMLNDKKNILIDELFLYLFENRINYYFNNIKQEEEKIKSKSLEYLKKSINFIEETDENETTTKLNHLGIIYAIAYIKCYFYYFSNIIFNNNNQIQIDDIENYFFNKNSKFRKVIKLYFFKVLFNHHFNDYQEFISNVNDKYSRWIENIDVEIGEINATEEECFFFDLNSIENYKKITKTFLDGNYKEEYVNNLKDDKKNFYSFIDLSINKIIYKQQNSEQNIKNSLEYIQNILELYNKNNYNSLYKILIDQELYNKELKNNNIIKDNFVGLLFGFKLSLLCQCSENSFYSKLMNTDYSEEINNSYLPGIDSKGNKGFYNITKEEFIEQKENIRNINPITYRFLNFVIFSVFNFNHNINETFFQIYENKSFLDLLITDWEILKSLLKEKKIDSRIFINQLIPGFIDNINNLELKQINKRNEFENKINDIVIKCLDNYNEFKHKSENLKLNTMSQFEKIIKEDDNIKNDDNDFPYYQYFSVPNFPNEKNLSESLKKYPNEEDYPILKSYLKYKNDEHIKNLKNILLMNPFENTILDKYSFNISRKDAKYRKKITDVINEFDLKDSFKNFKNGFDNISSFVDHYKKNALNKGYSFNKDSYLSYVLNDDKEIDTGMYIAGAYYYFYEKQNLFIESIIKYINKENHFLYFLKTQIEKTILIQDATKREIIDLDNINSAEYNSFQDILNEYSFRNIFKNNKIDYINYKEIIYDLDLIEEELGKHILLGKRKFSEEQKFIIYEFEIYHGKNSSFLIDFIEKYPQKTLSKEQKDGLNQYLTNKRPNPKKLLFSLQMLIIYLNGKDYKSNNNISDILQSFPNYINLNNECHNLFKEKSCSIYNLIGVYNYIEDLNYENILDNIEQKFKQNIEKDKREKIIKYFNKNIQNNNLIQKNILNSASRKYILRYIIYPEEYELNKDKKLIDILMSKKDIWDLSIINHNNFEKEIKVLNDEFDLEIINVVDFCNILSEKDKKNKEIHKNENNRKNKNNSKRKKFQE